MSVETYKLVAAPIVLAAGVIGGVIPRWRRLGRHRTVVAVADCFVAGVFFGVGLLHMLPRAARTLSATTRYPLAALLAVAAFVVLLFIEQALLHGREAEAVASARNKLVAWVVLAALSVHSFITGLALGTQRSLGGYFVLLAAVMARKSSAAFALGRVLQRTGPSTTRFYTIVLFFCLATPIGIVTGAVVSALIHGSAGLLVSGIFEGLAAGTFLYVGIADIVVRELRHAHRPLWLCTGFTVGVAIMALVRIWI